MGQDKETKLKLMESAKKEFWEHGFMKASLRTICKNADVTTGALYFFFEDKNDLFGAIVETPLQGIRKILEGHIASDEKMMTSDEWINAFIQPHNAFDINSFSEGILSNGEDVMEREIIHCLYSDYDAVMLLLTKAQGSRYENCVDEIVDMLEQGYRNIIEKMIQKNPKMQQNEYMMHWMTHMNIDACIHLLTHEQNEEKAMQYMEKIMNYILQGWMELCISVKE